MTITSFFSEENKFLSEVSGEMGKGGRKQKPPIEVNDTNSSKQVARLLIAVSEGVCEELTDIFFNFIPASNFNCTIEWRPGTVDQTVVSGFENVTNPSPSFTAHTDLSTSGVYIEAVDWTKQAAVITLQTSLMRTITDKGDILPIGVTHSIYFRPNAAATWTLYYVSSVTAKVSSAWAYDIRVSAPPGVVIGEPWEIKVVRDSPDDSVSTHSSKFSWTGLVEVEEVTLTYPSTALVGITLWDASQFGGQIPDILFKIKGIKVRIPTNYDPVNHTHTGLWNGLLTNVTYFTSNPAWILYDVLNSSKCLGIPSADIDLSSFYLLSTVCEEQVSNGFGGFESRYELHNQFTQRENIPVFLNYILSICNANLTTNEFGQISLMVDRPNQAVTKQFTNSNVIAGSFVYSSNDLEQRVGLVNVTYSNKNDYGKTDTATWEDSDIVTRYGLQTLDIALIGCNSESQAIRKARWALYQNSYLTNIINFKLAFEGMTLKVGEVCMIYDNDATGSMQSGRLVAEEQFIGHTDLILDRNITGTPTNISYLNADGVTLETVAGTKVASNKFRIATNIFTVANSTFILHGVVEPRYWKVVKIDQADNVYDITCLEHNTGATSSPPSVTIAYDILLHFNSYPFVNSKSLLVVITSAPAQLNTTSSLYGAGSLYGAAGTDVIGVGTVIHPVSPLFAEVNWTIRMKFMIKHSVDAPLNILSIGTDSFLNIGINAGLGTMQILEFVPPVAVIITPNIMQELAIERYNGIIYAYIDGELVGSLPHLNPFDSTPVTNFNFQDITIGNEYTGVVLGQNNVFDEFIFLNGTSLAAGSSTYSIQTSPYLP